jgi:serine/threonine protein kinase
MLIFETMGTPTKQSWEGFELLPKFRSWKLHITKSLPSKFKEKYSRHDNMTVPALGLVERMLEHNPKKRLRAERALESQYFLSHPISPDRPEKLGYINLGRDSHEFQTKPIRREAKNYAQQASQKAKENSKDEKSAYELAYMEYLRDAAVNNNAIISFNSYTNKSNNINKVGGWSRSPKFQESQIKRKRVRDKEDIEVLLTTDEWNSRNKGMRKKYVSQRNNFCEKRSRYLDDDKDVLYQSCSKNIDNEFIECRSQRKLSLISEGKDSCHKIQSVKKYQDVPKEKNFELVWRNGFS